MLTLHRPRLHNGENGFTLIEVMFAAGLAGLSMLLTMQLITYMNKANRSTTLTAEFNGLTAGIGLILGQTTTCGKSTLFGQTFDSTALPITIPSLTLPTGSVIQIGNYVPGLNITQVQFDKVIDSTTLASGGTQWVVNLHVQAQKGSNSFVGVQNLTRDFKVMLVTDTSNKITQCGGFTQGTPEDVCISLGGLYDIPTQTCDLARMICLKGGGNWNTTTKKCDYSPLSYTVVVPGGPGNGTYSASCNSGDLATGGGGEPMTVGATVFDFPNMASGRAAGWVCAGQGVRSCYAVCRKQIL